MGAGSGGPWEFCRQFHAVNQVRVTCSLMQVRRVSDRQVNGDAAGLVACLCVYSDALQQMNA